MDLDVSPTGAAIAKRPPSHVIAVGKTNAKGLGCSMLEVADHPYAEVDGLRFIGVGRRDAADVAHVGADLDVSRNLDAAYVMA